jgi:LDH2 family malate/lactate/ureidoglycolate dehydrogenase
VPGEPEWQAYQRSQRDGITLADGTVADLDRLAASLGVPQLTTHAHTQEEA